MSGKSSSSRRSITSPGCGARGDDGVEILRILGGDVLRDGRFGRVTDSDDLLERVRTSYLRVLNLSCNDLST